MINDFAVYQIIVFSISYLLILRTAILFIRKKKTIRELILAILIWGGVGLIGLYPNLTNYIAKITGFQLGINALLVISVIGLLYTTMKQSIRNDRIENTITRLVRNQALRDLKEQYLKK